jgi:DNA-binding CsgD family transcriptional regulator
VSELPRTASTSATSEGPDLRGIGTSALAAALSVLDLSDCEREMLVRATVNGKAATVPTQATEWRSEELQDAAEALAHDGLVRSGHRNSVHAADDLVAATTHRARQEAAAADLRVRGRALALHTAIMSRCAVTPPALRRSDDLEADFRALLGEHRILINIYPTFLPRDPDFFNAPALAASQLAVGSKVESDVVSSRRLRLPAEQAFFAAQAAVRGSTINFADEVPLRLTLLDDRRVVVPSDPLDHEAGAWVIDEPNVVAHVGLQVSQFQAAAAPWAPPLTLVLSDRETQVIRLLARGLTDEGIAKRLRVTDRTVRRTVAALMTKFGVDSRFALAIECAKQALV